MRVSGGGELIAVGFRDFLDEVVGSKPADQAGDPGVLLAGGEGRLVGQEAFAQVAVAEPVPRELTAADCLEQVGIGLGQRVQGAGRATVERGPLTDVLGRLSEGGGRLDGGQSLEVALLALLADLQERREGQRRCNSATPWRSGSQRVHQESRQQSVSAPSPPPSALRLEWTPLRGRGLG